MHWQIGICGERQALRSSAEPISKRMGSELDVTPLRDRAVLIIPSDGSLPMAGVKRGARSRTAVPGPANIQDDVKLAARSVAVYDGLVKPCVVAAAVLGVILALIAAEGAEYGVSQRRRRSRRCLGHDEVAR